MAQTLSQLEGIGSRQNPRDIIITRRRLSPVAALDQAGVGITFERGHDGTHAIKGLIPGGPAAESSLLFDGDRLLAVDSVVTDSLLVDQVRALILGVEGSPVTLTVETPLDDGALEGGLAINMSCAGHVLSEHSLPVVNKMIDEGKDESETTKAESAVAIVGNESTGINQGSGMRRKLGLADGFAVRSWPEFQLNRCRFGLNLCDKKVHEVGRSELGIRNIHWAKSVCVSIARRIAYDCAAALADWREHARVCRRLRHKSRVALRWFRRRNVVRAFFMLREHAAETQYFRQQQQQRQQQTVDTEQLLTGAHVLARGQQIYDLRHQDQEVLGTTSAKESVLQSYAISLLQEVHGLQSVCSELQDEMLGASKAVRPELHDVSVHSNHEIQAAIGTREADAKCAYLSAAKKAQLKKDQDSEKRNSMLPFARADFVMQTEVRVAGILNDDLEASQRGVVSERHNLGISAAQLLPLSHHHRPCLVGKENLYQSLDATRAELDVVRAGSYATHLLSSHIQHSQLSAGVSGDVGPGAIIALQGTLAVRQPNDSKESVSDESKIGPDWSFTRDPPASRDAVISALPSTLLPSGRAFAGHENTEREMQLFSSVQNRGGRRRLAVIGHYLIDENRIADLQAPPSVCPFSSPSSNVKSYADRYEGRVLDSKELDLGILDQDGLLGSAMLDSRLESVEEEAKQWLSMFISSQESPSVTNISPHNILHQPISLKTSVTKLPASPSNTMEPVPRSEHYDEEKHVNSVKKKEEQSFTFVAHSEETDDLQGELNLRNIAKVEEGEKQCVFTTGLDRVTMATVWPSATELPDARKISSLMETSSEVQDFLSATQEGQGIENNQSVKNIQNFWKSLEQRNRAPYSPDKAGPPTSRHHTSPNAALELVDQEMALKSEEPVAIHKKYDQDANLAERRLTIERAQLARARAVQVLCVAQTLRKGQQAADPTSQAKDPISHRHAQSIPNTVVKTKPLSRFSSVITGDDIIKVAVQPETVHVSNRIALLPPNKAECLHVNVGAEQGLAIHDSNELPAPTQSFYDSIVTEGGGSPSHASLCTSILSFRNQRSLKGREGPRFQPIRNSSHESSSDQSNASPSSATACHPLHLEEEELAPEVMAETAGQVEETRLCFHSEEEDADLRPSRLADSLGKTSEMVSNLVETVANLDSTFSRTDAWSRGNAKRLEERQKSLASPSAHNKVKNVEECNPLVVAGLPNRHQIRKLLLL